MIHCRRAEIEAEKKPVGVEGAEMTLRERGRCRVYHRHHDQPG